MSIRVALRRALHVLVAANMALALLHGPSMAFADAVLNSKHLSPHHGEVHKTGSHARHDDPGAPSGHQDHNTGAMPGCPLATFAAIATAPAALVPLGQSEAMNESPRAPLIAADPSLADPPPRSPA
jgi:hypothetical protein